MADRKRVHIVEQTVTQRYYYDPAEIAETFAWDEVKDNYNGTFDDFVIETFEQHDGSQFCDNWFSNDASADVGHQLIERWDDE